MQDVSHELKFPWKLWGGGQRKLVVQFAKITLQTKYDAGLHEDWGHNIPNYVFSH